MAPTFHGRRVLALESRRSAEIASLITTYGGEPVVAPSVREVPLESQSEALDFIAALVRGDYDIVILMTGVGTRLLLQLAQPAHGQAFINALGSIRAVARGPKPVAALREVGLTPWITAPSPNTWREVIAVLDAQGAATCRGQRVAVQEHGSRNPELVQALEARGADVTTVPIYQWALPEELEPLRLAVRAIASGGIDAVVLMSSVQLVHLLQVAADMRLEAEVRAGLRRVVVASIGPMTSEELRRQDVRVDLEASTPKMGFLVRELAERFS